MRKPKTRYVTVGDERVAYQVFGGGPVNLLYLKAALASVDALWEHPAELRIWRTLGEAGRTITFDHRGLGVSDAVPEQRLGDPHQRVQDAMAVLDHLGISQAAVLGEMDGSTPAIMLAVEHPERVSKLVIVNGSATGHRDDDHPFGLDPAAVESTAQMVFEWWGTGRVLATVAPGLADNADFAARFERLSARPRGAAAMFRRFAEYDVRDLLSLVRVPTLVIHSDDVPTVEVGRARYLADHILESRLLETTATSWYWGGGAMEEVVSFVTGAETAGDRDLATVLFTDVVSSTQTAVRSGDARWGQTLNFLDDLVTARVEACRGRLVKQTGDGHLAEFGRPGDAVSAALGILEGVAVLGVDLRLGVHTGEIERREGGDISGLAVHIAARVAALAQPNEVLVSRTVADLIAGSGIEFTDRGECELKGVPGTWKLFAVRG